MAQYIYVLRLTDPSRDPSGDALAATVLWLHPIAIIEPKPTEWIAGCAADSDEDARRQIESKLSGSPASVPDLEIVVLRKT
jgi:hypothetical protein